MLGLFIRSGEELQKDLYVSDQQEILYTAPWYKQKIESCLTKKKEKNPPISHHKYSQSWFNL